MAKINLNAFRAPETLPLATQWQMVEMVYDDVTVMTIGTFLMVLVSLTSIVLRGPAWMPAWGAAGILVLIVRLRIRKAFFQRSLSDPPGLWRDRFAYGAWVLGAIWGVPALLIAWHATPFMQLLGLTVQAGLLTGASVRNSAVPKAVIGQIYISLTPLLAVCLFSGDTAYHIFCVFIVLHMLATHEMAIAACHRTAKLLVTEAASQVANAKLARANQRLAALATTDGLTGVVNRRGFDDSLGRAWSRAVRTGGHISLVIFDVDYFKRVNDISGHLAGDDYLQRVAVCLDGNAVRTGDLVARYGGEEFVVLLADTDHYGAVLAAERLRAAVQGLALPHPSSPFGVVTVSGGVVTALALTADPARILQAADRALYEAKSDGRNMIRVADGVEAAGAPVARRVVAGR